MFNLGFSEILIIGVLALLLIGPKQLPEMARVLGRMMNEFKKATGELSGGLLDIKSELQKPMRDGMDAIHRAQEDFIKNIQVDMGPVEKTETTVHIVNDDIPTAGSVPPAKPGDDESRS